MWKLIDAVYEKLIVKKVEKHRKLLDLWFRELDPKGYKKREDDAKLAEEARKDRLLSLYAKAMVREKAEADAHSAAIKEWERWV